MDVLDVFLVRLPCGCFHARWEDEIKPGEVDLRGPFIWGRGPMERYSDAARQAETLRQDYPCLQHPWPAPPAE